MSVPSFPAGTRYLPNNIAVMNQKYAGKAYASNAKYFDGVTHSMPVDTVHTLGSELFLGVTSWTLSAGVSTSSLSNQTSTGFDIDVTVADGTGTNYPRVYNAQSIGISSTVGEAYQHSFDMNVISGSLELAQVVLYDSSFVVLASTNVSVLSGTGINVELPITVAGTIAFVQYRFNSATIGKVTIANTSFKKITLPTASYIQYLAYPSLTIKQLSSTGDVGAELVTNGTFDTDITGWVNSTAYWNAGTLTIPISGANESSTQTLSFAGTGIISFDVTDGYVYIYDGTTAAAPVVLVGKAVSNSYQFTATSGNIHVRLFSLSTQLSIFDNVSVRKSVPVSTTYTQAESFQWTLNTTAPLEAADILELNADQELIWKVKDGTATLSSGFNSANVVGFLDGTVGINSSKWVQDIVPLLGADLALNNTIVAGTATVTNQTINSADVTYSAGSLYVAWANSTMVENTIYHLSFDNSLSETLLASIYSGVGTREYVTIDYGKNGFLFKKGTSYNFIRIDSETQTFPVSISISNFEIREATAKEIANYTSNVNTTYLNGTTGATNLLLVKDASGRTLSPAPAGTISHTSDGFIDTEWLPNTSIYTAEETVTGNLAILDVLGVPTGAFSVRTETRRLIHEAGVGDSLYIDTVLQPYTPTLPNPLVSLKLGNTASIGYADTVTSRSINFLVKAIVSVP